MDKIDKNLIEAFKLTTTALASLEQTIKDKGYEFPKNQPEFDNEFDKINIPKGYIRSKNSFVEEYHLNELCADKTSINNIAYSLQYSDLLNYIINRFCITLSIRSMYLKYAIINTCSIFEAILHSSLSKIRNDCFQNSVVCKRNMTCQFYIPEKTLSSFNQRIQFVNEKILNLQPFMQHITDAKERRDNVHIWTASENEYLSGKYNLKTYNTQILLLKKTKIEFPSAVEKFNTTKKSSCQFC